MLQNDWRDSLGSQTANLRCDHEPACLAQAQEIRRLRRENSITILEHPEEEEKQSNHLAGGSVEHRVKNREEHHTVEFED